MKCSSFLASLYSLDTYLKFAGLCCMPQCISCRDATLASICACCCPGSIKQRQLFFAVQLIAWMVCIAVQGQTPSWLLLQNLGAVGLQMQLSLLSVFQMQLSSLLPCLATPISTKICHCMLGHDHVVEPVVCVARHLQTAVLHFLIAFPLRVLKHEQHP